MLEKLLIIIIRFFLWLRYSIEIQGMDQIKENGKKRILFLPNHPALIDPVIMMTRLYSKFKVRPMADEDQVNVPVVRHVMKRLNAVVIPDLAKVGRHGKDAVLEGVQGVIDGLKNNDNILLYPSGHIYRSQHENLGAASGAWKVLQEVPDTRVVLVRTTGLWGSSFSRAQGKAPSIFGNLKKILISLFCNGLVFSPRRKVTIELYEPNDLPLNGKKGEFNQYLEEFYNKNAPGNTFVPWYWWQGYKTEQRPEYDPRRKNGDQMTISDSIRQQVYERLQEISGVSTIKDSDRLANELGLDSLTTVEIVSWLESEYGVVLHEIEALYTVEDCLLAAAGVAIGQGKTELKPIAKPWFESKSSAALTVPEGEKITDLFLKQAKKTPNKVIIADQIAGTKTFRNIITAIMVLKPHLEKLPGQYIGIMLPATVSANILYIATLFTGKTPVMVNWTVGVGNMNHSLKKVGVTHILTAKALLEKLKGQGFEKDQIETEWVILEEMAKGISKAEKIKALIKSYFSWSSLQQANVPDTLAVLFTSGSESYPKAVPLTHANLLSILVDAQAILKFRQDDRLLGMLPPFHSLGLAATIIMPLSIGLRTVYHANPTEGLALTHMINGYKATITIGTPTFLNGILRVASQEELQSLRLVITGAEKCPDYVYSSFQESCPNAVIAEGYGITECSPLVSVNSPENSIPGTIGQKLPSMEYALVHPETREEITKGEQGLLLVRGANVFGGYINHDGKSPFVSFDGKEWYETGDLVKEGEHGNFLFCGRLKRFIKLGGEMISLPAIESALTAHFPLTEDGTPVLAVEATPSEDSPEVVLFTTANVTREAANQHIRDAGLSALHNIRQIIEVEEIPVLGTGKTDYRSLKSLL